MSEIHSAIHQALTGRLTSLKPASPVSHENEVFVPPSPSDPVLPQITAVGFQNEVLDEGDVYSIELDGIEYLAQAGAGEDLDDVLTRLAGILPYITAYDSGQKSIEITGAADGTPFTVNSVMPANASWQTTQEAYLSNQWLRPLLQPAVSVRTSLGPGGLMKHSGIYQVAIYTPVGIGWSTAKKRSDEVCAHFPAGCVLVQGEVKVFVEKAYPGQATKTEDNWYLLPVMVGYYCFTDN